MTNEKQFLKCFPINGLGFEGLELVHWAELLPCTWLIWVWYLASNIIPSALLEIIPDCKARVTPESLRIAGVTSKQTKTKNVLTGERSQERKEGRKKEGRKKGRNEDNERRKIRK